MTDFIDRKHFDINVHETDEGTHADVYPLRTVVTEEGERVLSPDTSVTLARVNLTPAQGRALGFPQDSWWGTDAADFPAALADVLAVTLDELRAA